MSEIRLCVSKDCNFKCSYCNSGGEGIFTQNPPMTVKEIRDCVEFLTYMGVDSVRITGGEPFIRKDIIDIIKELRKIKKIKYISIVTNGSLLTKEKIEILEKQGINNITVSLDTLDENEFKKIIGVENITLNSILNNIILLSQSTINVRINMVVTKSTIKHLQNMIDFCNRYGIDLKLLDLNNLNLNDWKDNYVELASVKKKLEKQTKRIEYESVRGNYGTPMEILVFDNFKLIFKDSTDGTCYNSRCKSCKNYPCQTGISSFVVTHDGQIKLCELGKPYNFNLNILVKYFREYERMKEEFCNVTFQKLWRKDDSENEKHYLGKKE